MKEITITTEYITLGQFLKYAGVIESGAMSKTFLKNESVLVNGEEECRRGRKLYDGYEVAVGKNIYIIRKMK
jgi:S4 domain protein YaaA